MDVSHLQTLYLSTSTAFADIGPKHTPIFGRIFFHFGKKYDRKGLGLFFSKII
jgi:hypothetical protein